MHSLLAHKLLFEVVACHAGARVAGGWTDSSTQARNWANESDIHNTHVLCIALVSAVSANYEN